MHKLKLLYQIFCILGAVSMTAFCFCKYFQNESVVSVSYRQFHEASEDIYPGISFCFLSTRIEGIFKNTNNLTTKDIARTMKGQGKNNEKLFENITYKDMTVEFPLKTFAYTGMKNIIKNICTNSECFKIYGDGKIKCFTHDIRFKRRETIKVLRLRTGPLSMKNAKILVYFHHPG